MEVAAIASRYKVDNPGVVCDTGDGNMDAENYQEILRTSAFTISPGGHNAQTYRMWEALEAG